MRERIASALKQAMKDRDQLRLATLRLISAAIKDRDISARADSSGVGEAEILQLLEKMVRQREESASAYESGGRLELAEAERAEIEIIREFMPVQLSKAELEEALDAAIRETGAESLRDMGKAVAWLKERYTGRLDFATAGKTLRARLSA